MSDESTCDVLSLAWSEAQLIGSPTWTVLASCAVFVVLCFVVSELTGNYSQVDKLWSITPFIYSLQVATDARTRLAAAAAAVWSIRLTYNFYRRGGYQWPPWEGEEDYRWALIRSGAFLSVLRKPHVYRVFNLTFICVYQHALLLLIASPAVAAHVVSERCGPPGGGGLVPLDYVATALILFLIGIEGLADQQQYDFQTEKRRRALAGTKPTGDYAVGFCRTGLFAVVRKPNYASEQAIWIAFYLYGVAATGRWTNASATGWILLVLLFQGSGKFTENLSKEKYAGYADYQQTVPLYVPNLFLLRRNKAKAV